MNLKLTVFLVCGILASLAWSIHQTASNSVAAFFSPFTRGWELALGALIAVGSTQLTRLPRSIATAMTWVGLGGILVAAFTFTATTPYPGSAAVLPVMSTALVLAGGRTHPKWGGEALLRLAPFDWLGRLSYSLYLWHWPILIIAAQHAGHPLSLQDNLLLLLLALGLSIASYYAIENPIRHARFLRGSGGRSIAMGTVLIGLALVVARYEIVDHSAPMPLHPLLPRPLLLLRRFQCHKYFGLFNQHKLFSQCRAISNLAWTIRMTFRVPDPISEIRNASDPCRIVQAYLPPGLESAYTGICTPAGSWLFTEIRMPKCGQRPWR